LENNKLLGFLNKNLKFSKCCACRSSVFVNVNQRVQKVLRIIYGKSVSRKRNKYTSKNFVVNNKNKDWQRDLENKLCQQQKFKKKIEPIGIYQKSLRMLIESDIAQKANFEKS
jgi:hypothetical protein